VFALGFQALVGRSGLFQLGGELVDPIRPYGMPFLPE